MNNSETASTVHSFLIIGLKFLCIVLYFGDNEVFKTGLEIGDRETAHIIIFTRLFVPLLPAELVYVGSILT